ncbi:MAG: hypothetical protein ACREJC_14130 [Tepidisphaeraceae bacterium]
MNRFTASLSGLALGLSLTGGAFACDTATGQLTKIDSKSSTIVVGNSCCGSKDLTFTLKKDTKVLINGKEATLADLKAGDKVRVDFEKSDDVMSVSVTRDS